MDNRENLPVVVAWVLVLAAGVLVAAYLPSEFVLRGSLAGIIFLVLWEL